MEKTFLVGTDAIKKQATLIRDIAQKAIDACDNWPQPMDGYARSMIMGGSLAKEAAALAVMILQAEFTPEEDGERTTLKEHLRQAYTVIEMLNAQLALKS